MNVKKSAIKRDIVIMNSLGLHLRPVSMFVQTAMSFEAEIILENESGSLKADGKSVTSMLALACPAGTKLVLHISGQDAENAADALVNLVSSGFGED